MDKYYTFKPRFWALIIDGLFISLINYIIGLIPITNSILIRSIIYIFLANLPYIYSVLMHGNFGQTVGKMILGIKIVDNITENKIGYFQALMRDIIPIIIVNTSILISYTMIDTSNVNNMNFSMEEILILAIPSFMLLIWSITEIITMFFNSKFRALHDIIAKTVVIWKL